MIYNNRHEAGIALADALTHYQGTDAVVLAVPRGGIQLGYPIAKQLDLPLEILLAKKLAHPTQREFAIGGVSLEEYFYDKSKGISETYIQDEIDKVRVLLNKRKVLYYGTRKPESVKGRIAIIVDDGIATGNTLMACIKLIRKSKPEKIVVAVPVAPPGCNIKFENKNLVDEFICLNTPSRFSAVGQFYKDFDQVSDEEVVFLLEKNRREQQSKLNLGM